MISNNYPSDKLSILDDSILGFLLNDKINLTLKVFEQSESLENCGKISATSTASEADLYSNLISDNIGYKLINTGTIDPFLSFWGLDYLTDKGEKYLSPYLPKDSDVISKNRHNLYSNKKIIISKIGLQCEAFYDKYAEFASINTNCIYNFSDLFIPEYLVCWLNSKLYNYTFECLFDGLRMSGGYLLFSAPNLKNTKIKKISLPKQEAFIPKADLMLTVNKELQEKNNKFTNYLKGQFQLEKLSKKLQKWYELSFADFIKEVNKAIKTNNKELLKNNMQAVKELTKLDEMDWMEVFETKKAEAQTLKQQINATDREIDAMVYELYGLTAEEIAIVENS
ncbi:TaqI-like C-terminal specificity domain-containing protein [Flavobacterium sp. 7A]|uniref:TaqI-like C-terminal specificity domain-containing protein n=1 Tax=Flavobacterium sp. 7A TaxID=2940571 RepID=UPI00222714D1|nr:hypothetical protein [Flavobacterium sp. 7A]MCW2121163.1 hypothetical protein [Flavobacterium sp. 7A]